MTIKPVKVNLMSLFNGYRDDGDDGVYAYDNGVHKLIVRPSYQREFVYSLEKQKAVIESILKNYPINVMYWAVDDENTFEILDGQQRTLSICHFMNGDFSVEVNGIVKWYNSLNEVERSRFDVYEITIYQCQGGQDEKLAWFKTINIAGEVLTQQELRNAAYAGTWLQDAKKYFSKPNCQALSFAKGFVKGNPVRQEILEQVLGWATDAENLKRASRGEKAYSLEEYMAVHQMDKTANKLWLYYTDVMTWAISRFNSLDNRKLLEKQDWGYLFNRYKDVELDENELRDEITRLLLDDDVTNKNGIITYILSGKSPDELRRLHIRTFPDAVKFEVWKKQGEQCPYCLREGINKKYMLNEMEADHITPWSLGGKTVASNCQMLCKRHNREKSAK